MKNFSISIGIDVSKSRLDVFLLPQKKHFHCPNNERGIGDLLQILSSLPNPLWRIVLEPSGGYEQNVLLSLVQKGYPVSLVPAQRIRYFAKAHKDIAKTDRIDACILARYGSVLSPDICSLKDADLLELSQWVSRRDQLKQMLLAEENRLEKTSLQYLHSHIQEVTAFLKSKILDVEKNITELLENTLQSVYQVLTEIKGVGVNTAAVLMGALPELGRCDKRSIAKLVGVAPMNQDSGLFQGKRAIREGRKRVRTALYMATLTAIRFNRVIHSYYEKLIKKGKPTKVAIVACMHKLLTILNARMYNFYNGKTFY